MRAPGLAVLSVTAADGTLAGVVPLADDSAGP